MRIAPRALTISLFAAGALGLAVLTAPAVFFRQARLESPDASGTDTGAGNLCSLDPRCARLLEPPSERPAGLTCLQARQVASQARAYLVQAPPTVEPAAFSRTTSDWLDPHGHWSAAPDSPVAAAIEARSAQLLAGLTDASLQCRAAIEVAQVLKAWVDELRVAFDQAAAQALAQSDQQRAWQAASARMFENTQVSRAGRALATGLGRQLALASSVLPEQVLPRARSRLFPDLTVQQWTDAVLAAALRAYVLHIDPHGAWAPLDEETSLYEVELEASGRTRMWTRMSRTAAGIVIDEGPLPPLHVGDLVLAIGSIPIAGLTVEQIEQLGVLDPADAEPEREVMALRPGQASPMSLHVRLEDGPADDEAGGSVHVARLPYGDSAVVVLAIRDVPDGLGEEVASALAKGRLEGPAAGVVIDLRGNGGGSIDGAKDAVSLFLPDAPLFPMKRRTGPVEVEIAPRPPLTDQWTGPLAAIIDGSTASAAEMIAGAIAAYRRGPLLGSRSYGKGCAQEYIDDHAAVGVLRLTTLLYALPDGSPVQRVGLIPHMTLGIEDHDDEREALVPHSPAPWTGPDVRVRALIGGPSWPAHGGRVGPCDDPMLCRALRQLGAMRTASRTNAALR